LADLYLWSLSHSSMQILSSSVKLDGERCCIFRSLQRCSIGFKFGLWLDHARTFRDLFQIHSYVVLLAFRPKSSVSFSSDQRILFLMVWESFRCLLANTKRAVMCLLLRSGFRLATLP
jgi:hypothetical protein